MTTESIHDPDADLDFYVNPEGFWCPTRGLIVGDPCYTDPAHTLRLDDAASALWGAIVAVGRRDKRVWQLTAYVVGMDRAAWETLPWRHVKELPVDAGMMGIYCAARYSFDESERVCDDVNTLYGAACAATASTARRFGVLRWEPGKVLGGDRAPRAIGVVSQTGWGDGSYPVDVKRDADGLVVGVRVAFIEDGDDGDDGEGGGIPE